MKRLTATALGFLVAPLIPVIVGGVLTPTGGQFDLVSYLFFASLAYYFALMATVLLGVPLFLILNRMRLINLWSSIVSGSVIGAIVAVTYRLPNSMQTNDILVMAPTGAVSAFVFWLIWSRGQERKV